jgi:hypothetical protein
MPTPKELHLRRRADLLKDDVAAMIRESRGVIHEGELAANIITVVRERVLQEVQTYARENIR